ncbi:GtrA family protein [Paenibacillus spongiae]|uniref:GtrA family protein n=1 Tax=Paenibacillus spongiae TaxID=2909671 RepID=A0ABY5S9B8_9BACL|nr:GtrA family protein [Paenibacillus spongiae]UVI28903.1 GtrA family protein [Paenibacillus spongiae]
MKWLEHSFVRFVIVGVVNTLIGLSVIFACLNLAGLGYWPSTIIGNAVGAVNSYVMNKRFTFQSKASVSSTLWRFMLVTVICYVAAYWISAQAARWLIAPVFPQASEAALNNAAALIGSGLYTVMNYAGQKKMTFGKKKERTIEWESEQ